MRNVCVHIARNMPRYKEIVGKYSRIFVEYSSCDLRDQIVCVEISFVEFFGSDSCWM